MFLNKNTNDRNSKSCYVIHMAKIKQLSSHEAQKIAAGEVVDRPANIVKELIENSIDAQATQITLYVEDGGKRLIRVVDNGCGMNAEDAHLCFNHHATSKITTVEDLDSINTFGFRGEALSSIASVSTIIMSTAEESAQFGIKLELEQGEIIREEQTSKTTGTDIAIHNLFYNLPARKKFLKSRETEWRHIIQLFYAFCLSYRSIHFTLHSDRKQIHNCPPTPSIIERIAQIWDHHLTKHMLELKPEEKQEYSISGAISNHAYSRFDRSMIFLFVNNRWIKNYHVSRAMLRGYSNVLQPGKYPIVSIFITVDPKLVDINIHPRKEEVKFLHPRIIETTLQNMVKETLQSHLSDHLNKKEMHNPAYSAPPLQTNPTRISSPQPSPAISFDFNKPVFNAKDEINVPPPEIQHVPQENNVQQAVHKQTDNYTIVGQLHKTYILLEQEDGLFIIDQHAAHERILYEQFSKRFENVIKVKLLFPQVIKISSSDMQIITSHLHRFIEKGIDIEPFGADQLIIHETPINLKNANLAELIQQTIGWILEYQQLDETELNKKLNEKMHAKMACTAAVKAGDRLSMQQMQQLIHDLEKTENRLTCPHGRPTGWFLRKPDLEKKFKRDYRSQTQGIDV